VNSDSFIEKTNVAVSEGLKPWSAREREMSASSSRVGAPGVTHDIVELTRFERLPELAQETVRLILELVLRDLSARERSCRSLAAYTFGAILAAGNQREPVPAVAGRMQSGLPTTDRGARPMDCN
jgi:hypothetical protein